MAIFKIANYISKFDPIKDQVINGKRVLGRKTRAKNTLHYMMTREGKNGEKMERQLFGSDGDVTKDYPLALIENLTTHTFHIILNFDPTKEDKFKDLNLEQITRLVMIEIQDRFGKDVNFVAVMHDDHTDKRHIHSLVFANVHFYKKDLKHFIQFTTEQALEQRRERDRDHFHERQAHISTRLPEFEAQAKPLEVRVCSNCGHVQPRDLGWECIGCGKSLSRRGMGMSR